MMRDKDKPSVQLTISEINPLIVRCMDILDELPLKEVLSLKLLIEQDLNKYTNILLEQNADMDTVLLTEDGFPRSDVDVLQITLARRNINMLRNDLSKVINQSHILLNGHFANNQTSQKVDSFNQKTSSGTDSIIPFAIISEIIPGSPVERAGVKNNDRLILVGNVNASNHNKLQNLKTEIVKNENNRIPIKILRDNSKFLTLTLIPSKNWDGNGILGCRFKEI